MSQALTCQQCSVSFVLRDEDVAFYATVAGKLGALPLPTRCPQCRLVRRLASRNESALYLRKSTLTGKDIISIYSPVAPYPVAELEALNQPGFDVSNFAIACDPSQSFFAQFDQLAKQVPHQALFNIGGDETVQYNNMTSETKNSYLCIWGDFCEDSLYNYGYVNLKRCVDNFWLFDGELSYRCVNSQFCYRSQYVLSSQNISDSAFIMDCKQLDHCLFCVNLRHKQYCIFNKQYTKEEYFAYKQKLQFGSYAAWQQMEQEFEQFAKQFPKPALRNTQIENCPFGDVNSNAKDCYGSFHMVESEQCCYAVDNMKGFNSYDCYGCVNIQHCNDCHCVLNCQSCLYCFDIYDSSNLTYCQSCRSCQDCFGCIGLRHKQYCIFNKQYTKEEYELLVPQLIAAMKDRKEWGEFFPAADSPFGYNESTAFEYFPLTKEAALSQGYRWSEYVAPKPEVKQFVLAADLPDTISETADDIVNQAVICAVSQKPFRITKQEVAFYREHNLPLPRLHPDERRRALIRLKNPRSVHHTICAKCQKETETSYPEDANLIIYCEDCYRTEVV
ncbi:zinc-ribbon domain containing protein [Candidatus Gracilibacteria bacterium]|nr:zinc-ribbon domain containing protein [Candidatus Gracilibacteria bacterium]